MNIYRKSLAFWAKITLISLVSFLVAMPAQAADDSRYLVKSKSQFLKNAFNARRNFNNGFTADLNEWQLKAAKLLGVEVESVNILQVLPAEAKAAAKPKPRSVPDDQFGWGVEAIYNETDLAKVEGGNGVAIAVLDTGIETTHPDLKARVVKCRDFTGTRLPYLDNKCEDKNGHGTHVAGIIAADGGSDNLGIYGVAPEAELYIYKVCSNSGTCYADDVAAAIADAAGEKANVINLSLGGDKPSSLIHAAIKDATDVLVVAAAGNDGPYAESIDYPAAFPEVVAVGAIDVERKIPEWSARGLNEITKAYTIEERDVEFAAPGVNIESTWKGGGYSVLSGTSMSTPFVSGLAAKYWAIMGKDKPADLIRETLQKSALDLLPDGDDNSSGFGLPRLIK
ncbi:MAG TPA: S8 family peptidase [Candidatus Paceibacterota bacterium]|nr:S8 family peptidase [Candidatus Paceibacterota bacterium]